MEKCNRHSHTIKVAISDSKISDKNFKQQINEKTLQLLKSSSIRKTLEGKYIQFKKNKTCCRQRSELKMKPLKPLHVNDGSLMASSMAFVTRTNNHSTTITILSHTR